MIPLENMRYYACIHFLFSFCSLLSMQIQKTAPSDKYKKTVIPQLSHHDPIAQLVQEYNPWVRFVLVEGDRGPNRQNKCLHPNHSLNIHWDEVCNQSQLKLVTVHKEEICYTYLIQLQEKKLNQATFTTVNQKNNRQLRLVLNIYYQKYQELNYGPLKTKLNVWCVVTRLRLQRSKRFLILSS